MNSQQQIDDDYLASNSVLQVVSPNSISATPTVTASLSSLMLHGATKVSALDRGVVEVVPPTSMAGLQQVLQSALDLIDDDAFDF